MSSTDMVREDKKGAHWRRDNGTAAAAATGIGELCDLAHQAWPQSDKSGTS